MTPPDDDATPTRVPTPPAPNLPDRYGSFSLGDGEVVVYDRENHRAWIQCDVALPAPV